MRTLLPALLDYSFYAPLFLRLYVAYYIGSLGREREKGAYGYLSFVHYIATLGIFLGVFLQIAALLGLVSISIEYVLRKKDGSLTRERLLLNVGAKAILLSLLVLGPGPFSIDLPL